MKLVSTAEMVEIENKSAGLGVSTHQLMENAGRRVADELLKILAGRLEGRIAVLVGPGNNGGDGLVAARHLASAGVGVDILMPVAKPANQQNLELAISAGARRAESSRYDEVLGGARVILDGFFGTGRSRPLSGDFEHILKSGAAFKKDNPQIVIAAIDIPSGLDSDTGQADPSTLPAEYTLTLGYPKLGLYNSARALALTGQIRVLDIGLPAGLAESVQTETLEEGWAASALPPRPRNSNKGTFGRLMIVAGSASYTGAAYLASGAAMRTGAGLATLAVPAGIRQAVAARIAEPTYICLPESPEGFISGGAAIPILDNLKDYNSLLIGCGLGRVSSVRTAVTAVLVEKGAELPPAVIDADALNILAGVELWWQNLGQHVITPHPGEMSRLSGLDIPAIQADRIGSARTYAAKWNKIVVLKGACTVIAAPDGRARVNTFSSAALASAGTGDVLSGVIAGFLAQGKSPFEAACLGVFLHARAGQYLSEQLGLAGTLASDLLPLLPLEIKKLNQIR